MTQTGLEFVSLRKQTMHFGEGGQRNLGNYILFDCHEMGWYALDEFS